MSIENRREIDLTDEQRRAVEAGDGLLTVSSGAGTGKTTALSYRVRHLIRERHVPPHAIVAVTFTRVAAREIAERIKMLTGDEVISATMHSLAARLLRENWESAGFGSARWQAMQEEETDPLFRKVSEAVLNAFGRDDGLRVPQHVVDQAQDGKWRDATRDSARRRITRWKENGLTPEAARQHLMTLVKPATRRTPSMMKSQPQQHRDIGDSLAESMVAVHLYHHFQAALEARDILEMSDIVPRAATMLERDPELRQVIAREARHLLVDEFQDSNLEQIRFLRLISSVHNNVCLIGDDDQSMYAFRGAAPDAMRRASRFFPEAAAKGVTRVQLTVNRRSPDTILGPAATLVNRNPRATPKRLGSGKAGALPEFVSCSSERTEAKFYGDRIEALLAAGSPPSQIAVLGRGGRQLQSIIKEMVVRRIPHRVVSGTSFVEREEVRDVLAWLRLALRPNDDLAFIRAVAHPPRGLGPVAVQSVLNAAGPGRDITAGLRDLIDEGTFQAKAEGGVRHMLALLDSMSEHIRAGDDTAEALVDLAINESGYLAWRLAGADGETRVKIMESMHILCDLAAETSVDTFVDSVLLADEPGAVNESGVREAVHVGTIHSAKGGEWDHVFLPGVSETLIPAVYASDPMGPAPDHDDLWGGRDGCLEEERRILHVGMTRAKTSLILSHAQSRFVQERSVRYRESPFMREMTPTPGLFHRSTVEAKTTRKRKAAPNPRKAAAPALEDVPDFGPAPVAAARPAVPAAALTPAPPVVEAQLPAPQGPPREDRPRAEAGRTTAPRQQMSLFEPPAPAPKAPAYPMFRLGFGRR